MRPLVVPPAALRDEGSIQMLSAWIAERGLHCTINIGFFAGQGHKEPKAWGIFLADVIRHIANAQNQETGALSADTVQELLDSLNTELEAPTSKAEGSFSPGAS
jgi:Domain of unknown function (DUF5076)